MKRRWRDKAELRHWPLRSWFDERGEVWEAACGEVVAAMHVTRIPANVNCADCGIYVARRVVRGGR